MHLIDKTTGKPNYRLIGISFLLVFALCVISYFFIDRPWCLFINHRIPHQYLIWAHSAAYWGKAEFYLIPSATVAILALSLKFCWPKASTHHAALRHLGLSALYLFLAIILSGILINIIKFLVGRYRPTYFLHEDLYGFHFFNPKQTMNSFPSGHSQAVWAAMTGLLLVYPRLRMIAIPAAIIMSSSRMFSESHYLSDVLMGSYIGALFALLLYGWLKQFGFFEEKKTDTNVPV